MCISKREAGFTLLELLVVIAVISLLAAIAIMHFSKYMVYGFDSTAKSDLRSAIIALEVNLLDNDTYPATSSALIASGFNLSENVTFTEYKVETFNVAEETVHMHVQHSGSPNAWHANYPQEGSEIQIR